MISVNWHPEKSLLSTRVAGVLTAEEVQAWKDQLEQTSRRIPKEQPFKMLIDIRNYEVADQDREVHQVMREVTPLFLAAHGFVVGFFKLYDVVPPIGRGKENALCIAVAVVHHDAAKMDRYNEILSTPSERFFHAVEEAEEWLHSAGSDTA